MRWFFLFCCLSLLSFTLFGQPIWVVTNTLDDGDGSLRQALLKAGNNLGQDTIVFDIPTTDPGYDSIIGVWSIESSKTFVVSSGTVIYGVNAFGNELNPQPGIEIHGTDSSIVLGLTGIRLLENVVLRGLVVNRFLYGIWIQGSNTTVENCYVGTDPTGKVARPNGSNGILVSNGANQAIIRNNLLSGNDGGGIRLFGIETSNNIITNNLIGTDIAGTSSLANGGNGLVLHVGTQGNLVIGNLISGNQSMGISLRDSMTNQNIFEDNQIGTDINGTIPLPNGSFGIAFFNGSSNNIFGPGNTVAFNGDDGVLVDGAEGTETIGNQITGNAISNNQGLGIDNFRGGNAELDPPVIDSIVGNVVYGTDMPNQVIELFFDESDEGCCYLGTIMADPFGKFSFAISDSLTDLGFITATATDTLGNTSEFSTPACIGFTPVEINGSLSFCKGMSTELDAGLHSSYLWSTGENTQSVTVDQPGTYQVIITDANGCTGSDSVLVVEYSSPDVDIITTDQGCANTTLAAGDFNHYVWSTGDTTPIITVASADTYWVTAIDGNGCVGSDSVLVLDDPLLIPWVQELINNPFNPYCNECLTLSQATWMDEKVLIFKWEASSCNFTDLGFTTIYSCEGDTIQHCYLSIAGEQCDPQANIEPDDLKDEQQLWQCMPRSLPDCPAPIDSILALPWVMDTLDHYDQLCNLACIGSNSGNFLYVHKIDTQVMLEFLTTCSDIVRRFYDCQGALIYVCNHFSISGTANCSLDFLPPIEAGELIWECPATTSSVPSVDNPIFKVYPTVVSDQLIIETESHKPWRVIICDSFGHVIDRQLGRSQRKVIDTESWPQGMLFAKIISGKSIQLVKLLNID